MFDLYSLLINAPIFLISLSIHEYAHGKAADMLGDPTPRWMGRLTLNPKAHIDPFGLVVLFITRRVGWAKPVPVNPDNFSNPRRGMLLVGLAGPIANFLLATALAMVFRLWLFTNPNIIYTFGFNALPQYQQTLLLMLWTGIYVNVGLGLFNLIPLPPLDGSRVLAGILPPAVARKMDALESSIGIVLVVFLAATGLFSRVLEPMIRIFGDFLTGL